MPDPVDFYSDSVGLNVGPFGCVLNFGVSHAMPAPPGVPPQTTHLASVRMSLEHLKTMAYILRNQVRQYERQAQLTVPVPQEVLNALRIGPEDWRECWGDR